MDFSGLPTLLFSLPFPPSDTACPTPFARVSRATTFDFAIPPFPLSDSTDQFLVDGCRILSHPVVDMTSILQIECDPQSGQYRYRIVEAGGDGEVLVPWRWGSFDLLATINRARSLFACDRLEVLK